MVERIVALIGARGGSKRIPDKNIKKLSGHPLMAYTIQTAKNSGLFDDIYITSDSLKYLELAEKYGARSILRPKELADGNRRTEEWVKHALSFSGGDVFFILPITNPFRTEDTILRAWTTFKNNNMKQLKSLEPCKQHPEKMFEFGANGNMEALYQGGLHNQPFHCLGDYYVQNACVYISECSTPIFGDSLTPFFTEGYEGFDINTPEDWVLAEELVKRGMVTLPEVKI